MRAGADSSARRAADEAVSLASASRNTVDLNNICWYGAVAGLARHVLPACELAVTLDPGRGLYRDSRALAFALLGELGSAAQDLRDFLASPDAHDPEVAAQRTRWLARLDSGQSPFDATTLSSLDDLPF